jgi:hypothetical protein
MRMVLGASSTLLTLRQVQLILNCLLSFAFSSIHTRFTSIQDPVRLSNDVYLPLRPRLTRRRTSKASSRSCRKSRPRQRLHQAMLLCW